MDVHKYSLHYSAHMHELMHKHTHTHTHTRARARARVCVCGGGGVRTGSHVHAHKQTKSLYFSPILSLSITHFPYLSFHFYVVHAHYLAHACYGIWMNGNLHFSDFLKWPCWLCFFSPLTDSTTISLCKRVALLTGNVFFHHALSVPNYSYKYRLPMSIFIILFFFFSYAVEGIRQWKQWQSHSLQQQFFENDSMCNGYKKYWRENWEYNCGMCSFFHHGSEEQHLNLST